MRQPSKPAAPPMRQTPKLASPAASIAVPFEQLDGVLRHLLIEHEKLLALAGEHKAAIAGADGPALGRCIVRQNEVVQRIAALEQQRQAIVTSIVRPPQAKPGTPRPEPSMSIVTAGAPEPVRTRLAGVAAALRDVLNRLHREHLAIRAAAEALSSHMEGLMRQVYQRLSHAGTYGRGGAPAGAVGGGVQVVSSVDVRS